MAVKDCQVARFEKQEATAGAYVAPMRKAARHWLAGFVAAGPTKAGVRLRLAQAVGTEAKQGEGVPA